MDGRNTDSGFFQGSKRLEIHRNDYNFQQTVHQIQIETAKPRFIFSHILLPHAPYFVNARGELIADSSVFYNLTNREEAFLDQVRYTNSLLHKLIDLIQTQKPVLPRVVIIEGDHGYRYFEQKKDGHRAFMNLNTYYFSDGDYTQLYNGISPVNSFRVVLNKHFKARFALLKDSSF